MQPETTTEPTQELQKPEARKSTLMELRKPSNDVRDLPDVKVGFGNLQGFELVQRGAKLLAASSLVPKEYQGNISNCVVALNMAARLGADPLMVMQNLVIVHNKPTWSSQFMIATINTCGRFTALRYEFFGKPNTDSWGCRAWAIEKATGEKLVGTDVTIQLAKDEKWYDKNGSKWKTMPQQMLMYRAGSWWARAYAPELSMGLHTADEMRDGNIIDMQQGEDGNYSTSLDELRDQATVAEETPHDPETGEIKEEVAKQNEQAAQSEAPEPEEEEKPEKKAETKKESKKQLAFED